jgi:Starch-binding associating with outer membrane
MASNADNLNCSFSTTAGNQNPIHQFQAARSSQLFAGATIVDMMNTKADPRRSAYFTTVTNAFIGSPIDRNTIPSPNYSNFGTFLRGTTLGGEAPMRLLTYHEYAFILAEYHVAKGNLATAQTFYREGMNASMALVGVATTASAPYVTTNGTLNSDPAIALSQIMEQKYIANYGAGIEPWTDWRRTGFPALTPAQNAISPNIPRVLPYPQNETDTNPNTPVRTSIFNKAIFWDK